MTRLKKKKILWETHLPSLPLSDAPEGEPYNIVFVPLEYGRVNAMVKNSQNTIIDVVPGHTFEEAYDNVREIYPQGRWDNPND